MSTSRLLFIVRSLIILFIVLPLANCGGGGGGGGSKSAAAEDVKQVIGANGGTIETSDGNIKLDVPANSLDEGTEVEIINKGTTGEISPIYYINVTSTTIQKPIKVTLSYDKASLPSNIDENDLFIYNSDQYGYVETLANTSIDTANHQVSGYASHFSPVTLGANTSTDVKTSDLTTTRDFRLPIGDIGDDSSNGKYDLGNDVSLLSIDAYSNNYPKIQFNAKGTSNKWAIFTGFNKKDYLTNYVSGSIDCYDPTCTVYHPGEDWNRIDGNDLGMHIHAIANGKVVYKHSGGGFGNIIAIAHKISNNEIVYSVYGHMNEASPKNIGDSVSKGDIIGHIGTTGNSTGPHLHFEIDKQSRIPIDQNGVIKVPTTDWYWPKTQDNVNVYCYDPSNFIKNIKGKTSWDFMINDNTEGWMAPKTYIENYSVVKTNNDNGIFTINPAASDPQIQSSPLNIAASDYNAIEISFSTRASNTAGSMYFKTLTDDRFTSDKRIDFIVNNNGALNKYTLKKALAVNSSLWSGAITGLRLDPIQNGVSSSNADEVKIDYIKMVNDSTSPVTPLTANITSVTGSITINPGQSVNFQGSASGGSGSYTYLWTFDRSGIANSTAQNPGSIVFNSSGSYTIVFNVTDSLGTKATKSVVVNVNTVPPLIVGITSPSGNISITVGQSVNFQGSVTGGLAPYTYLWTFGGAASNSTVQNPVSVTFSKKGTYTVNFQVSDSYNHVSGASVTITVSYPALVTSIKSPSGNITINQGQSVNFQGTASGGSGSYTYLWTFGGSGVTNSTSQNPGTAVFNTSGSYTVVFNVTDSLGTTKSTSVVVTVNQPQPLVANITSPSNLNSNNVISIAPGQALNFQGSVTGGLAPFTYSWNFGGAATNSSVLNPGTVTFNTPGTYIVYFQVSDLYNQTSGCSVTINVYPPIVATITSPNGNITINQGQSVNFQGSVSGGNGTYSSFLWDFGGGSTNSTLQSPGQITFNNPGTYIVSFTATDSAWDIGASSTLVVTVNYIPLTVISTSPAKGATGVATNSTINVTFSKSVDPSTVLAANFIITMGSAGVTVPGTVDYSGLTATFTPSSSLNPGTICTVTVTTGIKDLAGTALATNYTWSFTTASSLASGWVKTVVDSSNVGWGVRIKLDKNGLPGISYFNNSGWVNGKVNFAKSNGSTWVLEKNIYTCTHEGGGSASLAFDSNGQPKLVFSDYSYSHSYAEKNGSTWSFQTFSCLPDCSGSDIVVDSSNYSHIAWYTSSTLEYRVWNGGTWQAQTIDSAGDMGYAPQMVIDNAGHVYIAYGQWLNGSPHRLKLAYFNGSSWATEVVANTSNAGQQHSFVMTSQGYPKILYSDVNGNYNLATKINGSWQFKSTPISNYGGGMGFAIDASDHIHIICYQNINGTWYLMYYFYDGTTWTSTVIDQFTASPGYAGADLAVGSDGTVHIAYANPDTWSVMYVKLANQQSQVTWNKTFRGTGDEHAMSVKQTGDGGYIVAGYTGSFGTGNGDVLLFKTDANGNMVWNKTFGGSGDDGAYSVQQTSDGGYIVAGYNAGQSMDAWLIKTDANGNMMWNKTFGLIGNYDWIYSVQQTSDGGYIVAGGTGTSGAGGGDAWLIKTDANGNIVWSKTFGGTKDDWAYSVQQTSDGGYIVAGCTASYSAGIYDVWLIKTDTSGNMVWNNTFGSTDADWAYSVQQTCDGGYIMADPWGALAGLIKTDTNGNIVWNKTFGDTNFYRDYSVQQISDGGYIITGYTYSYITSTTDAFLIKTDAYGNMLWNKTFGGVSNDEAYSAQQTSDGGYIMTGHTSSYGTGGYDAWLIKTDANGNAPATP